MQKSESIGALAKALVQVQSNLEPAKKDANNPFFKSKYADLNAVWDACRTLLAQNGLTVIQGNTVGLGGTVIVETVLAHESGEWIQSELALPLAKNDPQGVGSAVTYGRRYGLAAIIGIVADVDDDGNAASGNGAKQTKPEPRPEPEHRPADSQEFERNKLIIKKACKELGWKVGQLNAFIANIFGNQVTAENFNEKQASTIAIQVTKQIKESA